MGFWSYNSPPLPLWHSFTVDLPPLPVSHCNTNHKQCTGTIDQSGSSVHLCSCPKRLLDSRPSFGLSCARGPACRRCPELLPSTEQSQSLFVIRVLSLCRPLSVLKIVQPPRRHTTAIPRRPDFRRYWRRKRLTLILFQRSETKLTGRTTWQR